MNSSQQWIHVMNANHCWLVFIVYIQWMTSIHCMYTMNSLYTMNTVFMTMNCMQGSFAKETYKSTMNTSHEYCIHCIHTCTGFHCMYTIRIHCIQWIQYSWHWIIILHIQWIRIVYMQRKPVHSMYTMNTAFMTCIHCWLVGLFCKRAL